MMTTILDGKKIASELTADLKTKIEQLTKKPKLVVIMVGNNPASKIYVDLKQKKSHEVGIISETIKLNEDVEEAELLTQIQKLNNDKSVNGILVQLPLPEHINTQRVLETIDYSKDVDGFHVINSGKIFLKQQPMAYPCTPKGILKILDYYNIDVSGKYVVVLGRSNIVGKPVAQMLLNRNATVTVCHSKTENIEKYISEADILISAIGKPKFIKAENVKQGAIIVDVGISRLDDGKVSGDVDFDNVCEKTEYITPVPGGVGPMTIACLLENTYLLYKFQNKNNFATKP